MLLWSKLQSCGLGGFVSITYSWRLVWLDLNPILLFQVCTLYSIFVILYVVSINGVFSLCFLGLESGGGSVAESGDLGFSKWLENLQGKPGQWPIGLLYLKTRFHLSRFSHPWLETKVELYSLGSWCLLFGDTDLLLRKFHETCWFCLGLSFYGALVY